MPMDAVYIAWGPPAEVLQSEDQNGAATVWVYYGGWMEENRYWYHRTLHSGLSAAHVRQGRSCVCQRHRQIVAQFAAARFI